MRTTRVIQVDNGAIEFGNLRAALLHLFFGKVVEADSQINQWLDAKRLQMCDVRRDKFRIASILPNKVDPFFVDDGNSIEEGKLVAKKWVTIWLMKGGNLLDS